VRQYFGFGKRAAAGNPVEHKVTTDENCPGCDNNHFSYLLIVAIDKYR
jgi:hypothetical protein